jgi:succinate dehydrogenase/fumarate reductase cytochrome b subunit
MDMLIRVAAIAIEVIILAAIVYALLNGARLIILDIGVKQKYNRMLTVVLTVGWVILVVFFIAHLTTFYPTP